MIQVINRALDLLEQIAVEPEKPKALGDLADSLQLNHGTCANILKTLVMRGYVEQIGAKKGYVLGPQSYGLTGNDSYRKDLLDAATDEMHALTNRLNENVLLAVLKGNQRMVLFRTYSDHDLQVRTPDLKNAYNAASGRLLLAFMTDAALEKYVTKFGLPTPDVWPEALTTESLHEHIGQIRREELAIQTTFGRQVVGLAVPIYRAGKVIASLSVYMPEYRYMASDKPGVVWELRATADRISRRLL